MNLMMENGSRDFAAGDLLLARSQRDPLSTFESFSRDKTVQPISCLVCLPSSSLRFYFFIYCTRPLKSIDSRESIIFLAWLSPLIGGSVCASAKSADIWHFPCLIPGLRNKCVSRHVQ